MNAIMVDVVDVSNNNIAVAVPVNAAVAAGILGNAGAVSVQHPGRISSAAKRHRAALGCELRRRGDGARIPGSDPSIAALQFGVSTLLSRRTLLDLQFGAGLTPDTPHYTLTASVPIRF